MTIEDSIKEILHFLVLDSGFTCSMFRVCESSFDNGQLFVKFHCILYDKHKGENTDISIRNQSA